MSYDYTTFQQALALYMAIPNIDIASPNFVAALPSIIDYAEQRCYRELDLLAARGQWYGYLTPLDPVFDMATGITLPTSSAQPQPVTVERVRILTPIDATLPPTPGTLTGAAPCIPTSQEFLDAVFGPGSDAGFPVRFAHTTQDILEFGPVPDIAYPIAIFGMYRPFPLYSAAPNDGTQTTFLSSNLPDLFLAAAMINASGYQKNFGAQSDDPKMAMAWETQFQALLPSARTEEMRKRFHGWQANTAETNPPPTPMPQPGG